jgi:hypothetical protein
MAVGVVETMVSAVETTVSAVEIRERVVLEMGVVQEIVGVVLKGKSSVVGVIESKLILAARGLAVTNGALEHGSQGKNHKEGSSSSELHLVKMRTKRLGASGVYEK